MVKTFWRVWADKSHGRRNDFVRIETQEPVDGVWVWPGVDKLSKDIGQMEGMEGGDSMKKV
jgi:hypothetical protein